MKKLIIYIGIISGIVLIHSCYNNQKDITVPTATALTSISFRDDIVPILTSGACGCHNNGNARAIQFSFKDTIYYGAILARSGVLKDMVSGKEHPGEGSIYFSPSQSDMIKTWIAQGAKDNYVSPPITGPVSYNVNIVPIYKTVCKGSTCHGGIAPTLDYAYMVRVKTDISKMMTSAGSAGHKSGPISLDGATTSTFLAWIAQGLPQ